MVVATCSTEHGLRGYPKTSGSKGIHVNVRIEPRLGLPRGAPRGARAGARGRAARARPGDEQVVEGGAPRRLRRLQPERARPHRRVRATRVRPTPDARVSCALRWDEVPDAEPGDLRLDTVPGAAADASAIRRPTSTSTPARWTRCSTSRAATRRAGSATRPGRRTSRSSAASPSASSRGATATARPSAAAPATRSPAARRPASARRLQRGFGSKPRTGQGYEHEFEE